MAAASGVTVGLVRVDDVQFHHLNRKDLGDLRPLAASITRNGLIHPLVVEKRGAKFRLRAGARRLQASRMAGLVKVPAIIHPEPLEDRAWLVHMAEENSHRLNLSFAERRDLILRMRRLGVQWIGIGAAFGVHPATARSWVQGTDTLPAEPADPRDPMAPDDDTPAARGARTPKSTPAGPRPPRTVAIRKVADLLDDLTAQIESGAPVTVEDCLNALHALLDAASAPKEPTHP